MPATSAIAPEYAHLFNPAQAAAFVASAAKYAALAAGQPVKQAPAPAPATIVYYETRWWVAGNKKATLASSPTTTAEFAKRNAAHYASKGYESEAVSVDTKGRKKVLA